MKYLIWSNERGMWWKGSRHGYTTLTHLAGQFTEEEARAICAKANEFAPPDQPEEVMCVCPWSSWAREEYANEVIDTARARVAASIQAHRKDWPSGY